MKETQKIETTAGLVIGQRISERIYKIRLNDPSVIELHKKIDIDGVEYDCAYVELGNPGIPHAVVLMPDYDSIDKDSLRILGSRLRFAKEFPKGANVSFVKVLSADCLQAVTFERGVEDFTLACGTGCGSIVSSLTLLGLVSGQNVSVQMPGGLLSASVSAENGSVRDIYLSGPTCMVCEGTVLDEDL